MPTCRPGVTQRRSTEWSLLPHPNPSPAQPNRTPTTPTATTTSEPTLTIVIATAGRVTLTHTLAATAQQLQPGDEILVLRRDTPWGHQARNEALTRSAGTHVAFIDDDDRHTDNALDIIRNALRMAANRVHLFAMRYPDGRILLPRWPLQVGHISTAMIVVPNNPAPLGTWSDRYEGDFDFIASTLERRGDEPMLHADVIADVRPVFA